MSSLAALVPLAPAAASRRAVLLLNVGTPDAPTTSAVRRYLREFLSDPRVIDLPALGRWLLLNLVILPFRPAKSAALYRNIWRPEGSPLLTFSRAQQQALQRALDSQRVLLAMRYGRPSIAQAVEEIARDQVEEVVVVPLFPQYSSAATGTAVQEALRQLTALPAVPTVRVVGPFHAHPGFLSAQAALITQAMADFDAQHVLFSYHGLPVHQVQATAASTHGCHGGLGTTDCCAALTATNSACYRAQCFATSRALAERLGLKNYSTSFQSRLGRAEWIRPYTEVHLQTLVGQGVKRLLVACPSFVADCLETLEEVGLRTKEQFLHVGGEALVQAPCVNEHPDFIAALAELAGTGLK